VDISRVEAERDKIKVLLKQSQEALHEQKQTVGDLQATQHDIKVAHEVEMKKM